jgi:diguanylate cyclase (GGDEF)-like protein/PAS domain S-box-containing protein
MSTVLPTYRPAPRQEAPSPEVSIALIDSLYKDGPTFLVGTMFVAGPAFITYWKTGNVVLLSCAVAIALVGGTRGLLMYIYWRMRSTVTTLEVAKKWEHLYLAGATVTHVLLGMWCYVGFSQTSDPFVHLFSFSMTILYGAGIFGRNFANPRFVMVQILCLVVPMAAALLLYGNSYYWMFAGFLTTCFLAIKFIADRLRGILFDFANTSRDMALLANRFDTALNNMPHGLCMFDGDGHIVVANQRLCQLLGLQNCDLKGLSLRSLLEKCRLETGLISEFNSQNLLDRIDAKLCGRDDAGLIVERQNGRFLEFTLQHMNNGGLVLLAEDVTERKAAEAEKDRLARFDSLTGLPNRVVLRENIERALSECRPGNMCAVHFIDLDQFKQVNDTLGHSLGDMLLEAVAKRLLDAVRDVGVIARFGGDEFVVLQTPITSLDECESLAKRILASLGGTYELDGHKVVANASIGVAIAENEINSDQFLRNADLALYRAKSEGRGTWRWFEPSMEARAQARRTLELDLLHALESDAFELYYQPLLNLKTRRIVTCEALLRWRHPIRGMVPPSQFIPVAEEMGLIVEIGNQVLNKACRECLRWPESTSVAVNLSPMQFSRSNVPALVREALAATTLAANRLEVEITESTLLRDTIKTRNDLEQLEHLGVKISLDDFGTAYSSLSYLHSFPFHKVKIDQSFLRGLVDDERRLILLSGMTRLSARLGLRVVVEGVETVEQLELLASDDSIDEVQGYLLGRPMPASDVRLLLSRCNAPAPISSFSPLQQEVA